MYRAQGTFCLLVIRRMQWWVFVTKHNITRVKSCACLGDGLLDRQSQDSDPWTPRQSPQLPPRLHLVHTGGLSHTRSSYCQARGAASSHVPGGHGATVLLGLPSC